MTTYLSAFLKKKMHTGQKIKMLRKLLGITQDQLAEKINKTRPLVSGIEKTGQGHPYTIVSICKALKIKPEQLEQFDEQSIRRFISGKPETDKKEMEALLREMDLLKDLVKSKQDQINMLQEELAIYKKKKRGR
jgi:transcriptional regulator with XRE-family HTH domain